MKFFQAMVVPALLVGLALAPQAALAGPLEDAKAAEAAKDYVTAERLLRQLAEAGNAEAQYELGGLYQTGRGVPQSDNLQWEWMRKSADQAYAPAQHMMGLYHSYGLDGTPSLEESIIWTRKAADQGYVDALSWLAIAYEGGRGVEQSYGQAMQIYRGLAARKEQAGYMGIARLYKEGKGVPQSNDEAMVWLKKAADLGNSNAKLEYDDLALLKSVVGKDPNALGIAALDAKNYPEATRLLQIAADLDAALKRNGGTPKGIAQYPLGMLYLNGAGVPQSPDKAREWFELATTYKNANAYFVLGEMYSQGVGVAKDTNKALDNYIEAGWLGNAPAMFRLGFYYESTGDKNGALVQFEKAEALGMLEAASQARRLRQELIPATPPANNGRKGRK